MSFFTLQLEKKKLLKACLQERKVARNDSAVNLASVTNMLSAQRIG